MCEGHRPPEGGTLPSQREPFRPAPISCARPGFSRRASRNPPATDVYDVRGRLRLTWLELGIVVVTLAVGTTVAGADLASRRIQANEASAVATLRMIGVAQEQFRAMGIVDANVDGIAEYGVLRELAGGIATRTTVDGQNGGGIVLSPSLLQPTLGLLNRHAEARQSGYLFKVFLAGSSGSAVEERTYGTYDVLDGTVDPWAHPSSWCAYAWPNRRGRSGRRTYFLNQDGVISATSSRRYSGTGDIDEYQSGAALVAGEGAMSQILGTQALGTVGRDGNFWRVVE